jgi:hypothetical protein
MPNPSAEVLLAVEEGRLSVEEVVERMSRLRGAQKAARELAQAARHRDRRRSTVRRAPFDERFAKDALEAFARSHGARPDVLDWHWGKPIRGGAQEEGVALVVRVRAKLKLSDISPEERLPSYFEFEHEGATRRVRLDVQETERGEKQAAQLRSARASVSVGARTGTLSALLSQADAARSDALFSGHVAVEAGAIATLADFSGDVVHTAPVERCIDDEQLDGAIVRDVPVQALAIIGQAATEVRDDDTDLIDLFVEIRTVEGETRSAFVDDVGVGVDFAGGPMAGLIRLSRCVTVAGDSGATATDSSGKIVGFVIGRDADATRTFLIPARKLIDAFMD